MSYIFNSIAFPLSQSLDFSNTLNEAQKWFDLLFDKDDCIEFRFLPPKAYKNESEFKFKLGLTSKNNSIYRFKRFRDIQASYYRKLTELNLGNIKTYWQNGDTLATEKLHLNIYAGVNPRCGFKRPACKEIKLIRTLFADFDKMPVDTVIQKIKSTGMPDPSMIVNSGNGAHAYWLLDQAITDKHLFNHYQKRLIATFDSDPRIHDLPRVMRIPGFINWNGSEPAYCQLFSINYNRYNLQDLDCCLTKLPHSPRKQSTKSDRDHHSIGRNNYFYSRACSLSDQGFEIEKVEQIIATENSLLNIPLEVDEVSQIVQNAFKYKQNKLIADDREIKSLDEWRKMLVERRLSSNGKPGIYLDQSTTGAGKSTADIELMKIAGKTLTALPTHKASKELVESLINQGLNAAAVPPIDESTCVKFGTRENPGEARIAQKSGLNVGKVVCPLCPLFKTCQYQLGRKAAQKADHLAVTHHRASLNNFQDGKKRNVIFIHEDIVQMIRPAIKILRHGSNKQPSTDDLRQLRTVISQAKSIANDMELNNYLKHLDASCEMLITVLDSNELLGADEQRIKPIEMGAYCKSPKGLQKILFESMQKLKLYPHASALKLSHAYASGELGAIFAVADEMIPSQQFNKGIIGIWSKSLPEQKVVWIEDASAKCEVISRLFQDVKNMTPEGRLAFQIEPLQYQEDVTRQASDEKVLGIIRGFLAKNKQYQKLGLIMHQNHMHHVKKLSTFWKQRISRSSYFHSGEDEGSNSWITECDSILIIGTPRVPGSCVRDLLLQLGMLDAALKKVEFVETMWVSKRSNGLAGSMISKGYTDADWKLAHNMLVRESLIQSVGRGRSVTDRGIPVHVISNEDLGIMVADGSIDKISTDESILLETAYNVIDNKGEVTTNAISMKISRPVRTIRDQLAKLEKMGLIQRISERKGWTKIAPKS